MHYLGHPPFGHAGEEALDDAIRGLTGGARDLRRDERRWEGTAQSGFNGTPKVFALLFVKFPHKQGEAGLQLTRATLKPA